VGFAGDASIYDLLVYVVEAIRDGFVGGGWLLSSSLLLQLFRYVEVLGFQVVVGHHVCLRYVGLRDATIKGGFVVDCLKFVGSIVL